MSKPSDRRSEPRHSIGLLVRVAAKDAEELAERYATNISRGGVFLRTRDPKPIGTVLRMELRLSDGSTAIRATGVVRFVQPEVPHAHPPVSPGMGIQFTTIDEASQALVNRVCDLAAERAAADEPQAVAPELPDIPPPTRAPPPPPPEALAEALAETLAQLGEPEPEGQAAAPEVPAEPVAAAPAAAPAEAAPEPPPLPDQAPEPQRPAPPQLAAVAVGESGKHVLIDRTALDLPGLAAGFEPKRVGPIIGIDLGTTYSCAAYVKNGKAVTLPSREGYATVPSILALNSRARLVVGHPAKNQMQLNPRDTVYGAKRLVGRPYESPVVRQIRDRFFYDIVEGPSGEAAVELGGAVLTLQEVSALILKEVRDVAQNNLGREIHRAVVTCPAYYNDHQREAVREAGRLAGLHVERILNEPTAAALAYGYGKGLQKRILVYDLGGGTFDASVLELHESVYEVLSTGGDTFLGGVDFDNQLLDHLLERFQAATGGAFEGDRVALQRITDAAERAKCVLSERDEYRIHVPFVTMVDGKPFDLDVTMTRAELEELTLPLVERTIHVCRDVLEQKQLSPSDIDEVVLVGGMSRMPLVRQKLKDLFGRDLHKGVHPDEAVALGAALLGQSLEKNEGVVLIDVLAMSIGLGLPGGTFKRLIDRNTSLPVTRTMGLVTNKDSQTSIEVPVFQGENDEAAQNEYLGTLTLSDLPRAPRGAVKVAVTFHLSAESLLTVTARELLTGKSARAVLSTRGTPEEVRKKMGVKAPTSEAAVPGMTASDGQAAGARPGRVLGFFKKLFGNRPAA